MLLLAIRFAVELFGVAAAAAVGASAPVAQPWPAVLAVAAPVALVAFWGTVAAPKARNPLPTLARELIGTAVLLVVAGLLAAIGQVGLAAGYAAVMIVDHALIIVLDPRPAAEPKLAASRR